MSQSGAIWDPSSQLPAGSRLARRSLEVRETASLNLPEVVDLLSWDGSPDSRGGLDETYKISHQGVKARLAERTGEERAFAGSEDVLADYILTVPFDQNIDETMEVQHEGQRYKVKFVNAGRSYDTVKRCLVQRV